MAANGPRPMQRLVMVTSILTAAGPHGRAALELADAVGYRGTDEGKREQLARLIRDLQAVGVDVSNVAPQGQEARWVLRPQDSRIRLAFTPDQQAELARAALLADRALLADGEGPATPPPGIDVVVPRLPHDVDLVLRAVTARCLLAFDYNGKARQLDPVTMQRGVGGWAVSGRDRGSGEYRTFYLGRMSNVSAQAPGTAAEVADVPRGGTDPLSWRVDPPLDVTVRVDDRYGTDALTLLGEPMQRDADLWQYRVTNRWAFFSRLVELGERVWLIGPEPVRAQFAEMLRQVIT